MRKKDKLSLMILLTMMFGGCNINKKKGADENSIKILDEHVVAMAIALGKDQKSYRMHIRTDVDGAKIYRQVGRYIIVESNGEVTYIPDNM